MRDVDRAILLDRINARTERLRMILNTGELAEQQGRKAQQGDKPEDPDIFNQQPVNANLYALALQELNQLKANLKWLEGDNAGNCEDCGCPIPMNRLLAVPTTRKCIHCASGH